MRGRPKILQRVQYDGSFTQVQQGGLFAQAQYTMPPSHWLNMSKITKHLNWNDKSSEETTPFISLFDSEGRNPPNKRRLDLPDIWTGDAVTRARFLQDRGYQNVRIISINTSRLHLTTLPVQFSNETMNLPVWMDGATGTVYMAMADIGPLLGVDYRIVQRSEWLATGCVPVQAIIRVQTFQ
jgi:hypothetical protein